MRDWLTILTSQRGKTREYSPHQLAETAWALSWQSGGRWCSARGGPTCCSWTTGHRRAAWRRGFLCSARPHCEADTGWISLCRPSTRATCTRVHVAWRHVWQCHCLAKCPNIGAPWSRTRASAAQRHAPPLTMGCHVARRRGRGCVRLGRGGMVTTSSLPVTSFVTKHFLKGNFLVSLTDTLCVHTFFLNKNFQIRLLRIWNFWMAY